LAGEVEMPEQETRESAAKYFKHPGWKLLAVFMQYVVGPATVAIITSYGIYLTNIQGQVKDDVRRAMDVREVVSDYVDDVAPTVSETPAAKPAPAPIESPVLDPPPELIKRWERIKGDKTTVPLDDLRDEYRQRMQRK
jgi:hypothetical protein